MIGSRFSVAGDVREVRHIKFVWQLLHSRFITVSNYFMGKCHRFVLYAVI